MRRGQQRHRAARLAWARAFGRPLSAAARAARREESGDEAAERILRGVRMLTHGDPDLATGAERRGLFEEVMARRGAAPGRSRGWTPVLAWTSALSVALVLVLWVSTEQPTHQPQPTGVYSAVRGHGDALPVAGMGLSGVDQGGSEYEVVHGDGLCPSDALRFYLSLRAPMATHYALFAVRDVEDPTWLVPGPGEDSPALPELPRLAWMVPDEFVLDDDWEAGVFTVVCILSQGPMPFARIEAAWEGADGETISERAATAADALAPSQGLVSTVLVEEIELLESCGRRP